MRLLWHLDKSGAQVTHTNTTSLRRTDKNLMDSDLYTICITSRLNNTCTTYTYKRMRLLTTVYGNYKTSESSRKSPHKHYNYVCCYTVTYTTCCHVSLLTACCLLFQSKLLYQCQSTHTPSAHWLQLREYHT